jgi:ABC-type thiamin/hydroxymethylpyrimidine transport system permease subunit
MVIDVDELGIGAVLLAIIGVLAGVLLVGLIVAAAASRLGGRRFGFTSICLGIAVSLSAGVVFVVVRRTIDGEVTGWDLLWAAGLAMAAVWSLRRLAARPHPPPERS